MTIFIGSLQFSQIAAWNVAISSDIYVSDFLKKRNIILKTKFLLHNSPSKTLTYNFYRSCQIIYKEAVKVDK